MAAKTHYDAIVFGSGAAGLTCATTLAKHGLSTMLAEKQPYYGGYAHGFGKDGFYWDHGGHIFLAYRLGKQAREVFQRLKLDERVEMVPDQHDYRCIFPGESMELPAEMSAAADIMGQRFPKERDGIAKVFMTMERMIDEVDMLVPSFRVAAKPGQRKLIDPVLEQFQRPRLGSAAAPFARTFGMPGKTLLRYQNRTFKQLLDEHLDDPLLKAYFSMLCVGIAAAPAELSAVIAGVFFVHALRTMWMPRGGFGKIAEALAEMFEEAGGTIELDADVNRVLVKDGRAIGVETADGRTFTADAVVSACDAKRLFLEMLPPEVVPADLRQRLPRHEDDAGVLPGPARRRHGPRAVPQRHQAAQLHLSVSRHRPRDGELPERKCRGSGVLPLRGHLPPARDGAARPARGQARVPDAARLEGDRLGPRQGGDRGHVHSPDGGDHPRPVEAHRREGDPDAARPAARHRQLRGRVRRLGVHA